MNRTSRSRVIGSSLLGACLAAAVLAGATNPPPGTPRAEQWKKADEAVNKGLPKTAVQFLEPIIEGAVMDKAYPEAIRAIGKKIALEGTIQGNKPEERITRMREAIDKAPKEMRPVMHALLAHWYWHYYQQNRWRFLQRTQTAEAPGPDFTTWPLPRLFAEIGKHFALALADEKTLKATPIATYDALLEKGSLPDKYRPTLFDFLAFDALEFYTAPEQAGARPQDAFELEAGGPILAPVEQFLAWQPQTTDADSPTLRAVKLYQAVLAFHKDDADKTAFLDADLHRLRWGYNAARGEEKATRYKAALTAFAGKWADHELSALARAYLAEVINGEGDPAEARTVAQQGANVFPESPGGKLCYNLIRQIEARALTISTERVWTDPMPVVRVRYKNLTRVHFRAVKADWVARLTRDRYRPEMLHNDADRRALLARKPEAEWAADLPATPDYRERTEDVAPPKDLPPGFYFVFASPDPAFKTEGNVVAATDVWVTDLALVIRQAWGQRALGGFVLTAGAGEPVVSARVRTWQRQNDNSWAAGPTLTTDGNGHFRFDAPAYRGWVLLADHDGQQLAAQNDFYLYDNTQPYRPTAQSVLFTDRSLYRPGQTVHYKGIALVADTTRNDYRVLPRHSLTVVFTDPNGKEVARQPVRSNDFGSFSGSFTAPRDRLTGQMQLLVQGDAPGSAAVSVEEYKRPKFQVTLAAPPEAARLSQVVTVPGKAVGYTGAAVGGTKVVYRVTREVRWPIWFHAFYWWRLPPHAGATQEIAHGTAVTAADGTFTVTFTAKPDTSVPEKDEPTFHFTVHADVTDLTGETRSADRGVSVGYTALRANLTADDWQTADRDVKVTIATDTLDGEGQAAKGTVKVYRLKQPEKVHRPDILGQPITPRRPGRRGGVAPRPEPGPRPDPSDPRTWELGDVVATRDFATDAAGKQDLAIKLDAGLYRAVAETQDRFGKPVTARAQVRVLNPDAAKLDLKVASVFAAPKWTLEPGEEFTAVWGTGYDRGRAYVEVEYRRRVIQSYWTDPARTQVRIAQKVTDDMRGGFTVRVTFVRENRSYPEVHKVDVPWTNKDLTVKWEHFVSKLEPGKKESFAATVTGPKATKAVAEMVATLYDASLDAYLPHHWPDKFHVFWQDFSHLSVQFENSAKALQPLWWNWEIPQKPVDLRYRSFPPELTVNLWGYMYAEGRGMKLGAAGPAAPMAAAAPAGAMPMEAAAKSDRAGGRQSADLADAAADKRPATEPPGPDLSKVSARKNLNELAFFFPHLVTGPNGEVRMEFTMPEALTTWKFLGFAHDRELRAGSLHGELVTAKDLMVQPNPPRFLREGDVIEFSVKVSNQSPTRQTGSARLTIADARTLRPLDKDLGITTPDVPFDIPPAESRAVSWRLTVPDGLVTPVTYKVVGATDRLSDGEEGMLPVLSKRVFVTESIDLPIRGMQTKTFEFKKLAESGKSDSLKTQALTVQMTSQPAWYAVMALPYLMEFPYECSEQVFNRLYANALARHIATGDPKIRRVFDLWKNTPALDSPLQKNQDLKAVALEETPWVRAAESEAEARRNVGVLFDDNRLAEETTRNLRKLADAQLPDGTWPWFPGGPSNEYITLYIATGFGRLRHLGVQVDVTPAVRALTRLDAWMDERHKWILTHSKDPEANHLSTQVALYLYGRSFFLKDKPVAPEHRDAFAYWQRQAKTHWLELPVRQSQAHLAVALKRLGDPAAALGIMASIKERSVSTEELGLFWRDQELSWWWFHAPIETQAMMIEAFDEVSNDGKAVEDAKVWLLKQKQTRNWKTTKATADAVYALLLRGDNLLRSDAVVEVILGDTPVKPPAVEAGTGYYEEKFVRGEVKPEMARITVKKPDAGVSWGSVSWQYLEDVGKVTPHEGTPLKLEKTLYKRVFTKAGPVLEAVTGPVAVGDEIVCRVVLRTDRDMEYVHLKDHRGSGTEPVNVLSRYKFQDGLAYYESTKDTATHFFIDYLPKGVYVFEYAVRVQLKGTYPTGLAQIQCMYAPEFNSHSGSVMLEVK